PPALPSHRGSCPLHFHSLPTRRSSDLLNMQTDLEVLEPRVFRERLWKQDLQFVWIRWFMDYPDPHNEYFDTFYGKKTTGKRQARSEEHTSELQSRVDVVCRLLLEKKKE